ncbi:MAG: L-seryl-tRNA(Sec) selenium transferase [Bacillota bacterium]|nr:L-seryl-tRNA(Sec) selenium transferase [Bacillota bacterium]
MMTMEILLRQIPAVDEITKWLEVERQGIVKREVLVQTIREATEELRQMILSGQVSTTAQLNKKAIVNMVINLLEQRQDRKLTTLINATGVVLHTNLGRAVLSDSSVKAIAEVAANYNNLELDLTTGERGSRYSHVEKYICKATEAEAALVVNNNAGAVLLVLAALGQGKEAIVSRGELVEIGGSFRVPDVMAQSGVDLVEVGTTNKTYLKDYETAITEKTGILLKVHTSNYRIVGFTRETTRSELVSLGKKYQIPVVEDLGSGFLIDLKQWGITDEPQVKDCVASGVDIVTFSGDKLLGGPQAGIIVGKQSYIDKLKKHPLTRALRIDKFTVAALEATLREYLDLSAIDNIPTIKMLTTSKDEIAQRSQKIAKRLEELVGSAAIIKLEAGSSMVGGGALPTTELSTLLITIRPINRSCQQIAKQLRQGQIKVVARVQDQQLVIDMRTVFERQEEQLLEKLVQVVKGE